MLADDHVCIRAAEAERADRGLTPACAVERPILQLRIDVERTVPQLDVLIEPLEVDRRRELFVRQRHYELEHSRNAGGIETMADVALDRAQGAVLFLLLVFRK